MKLITLLWPFLPMPVLMILDEFQGHSWTSKVETVVCVCVFWPKLVFYHLKANSYVVNLYD